MKSIYLEKRLKTPRLFNLEKKSLGQGVGGVKVSQWVENQPNYSASWAKKKRENELKLE